MTRSLPTTPDDDFAARCANFVSSFSRITTEHLEAMKAAEDECGGAFCGHPLNPAKVNNPWRVKQPRR